MGIDSTDMEIKTEAIYGAARTLADAITPLKKGAGTDAAGGNVDSLTELIMGVTAGLMVISDSVNNLAEAIRDHRKDK